MTRLEILTLVKQSLSTDTGQPDKYPAICYAVDGIIAKLRLSGQSRTAARAIQNDVMVYISPHLTFRAKLNATSNTKQIQDARHQYIQDLIDKELKTILIAARAKIADQTNGTAA